MTPPSIDAAGADERDARIAALDAVVEAQRVEIAALKAQIATLLQQIAALKQTSANSSKPPSSDPPSVPPSATRATPGSRKRGGQPGHKGSHRERLEPDFVVDHRPASCSHCSAGLSGNDPEPQLHQVTEIPRAPATVTEHRLHRLECQACGQGTRATLPTDVPRSAFGPTLVALIALLSGQYRLGKREIVTLLGDWFGVQIALGSISACEQQVSQALATPYDDVKAHVQAAAVVHADETSWREGSKKAWLWVACATVATLFVVHARRSTEAAKKLLGDFAGILVTDRWTAYNAWDISQRQLCWARLARHWLLWSEWPTDTARTVGRALDALTATMFAQWHKVRDGTLSREQFQREMVPIRTEVEALLEWCAETESTKPGGMAKEILALRKGLWTFVDREGVEPTNNFGERQIRQGVRWRKNAYGTDSERGSRFAERILTVVATLKQQKRGVADYVIQACEARLRGQGAPGLVVGG